MISNTSYINRSIVSRKSADSSFRSLSGRRESRSTNNSKLDYEQFVFVLDLISKKLFPELSDSLACFIAQNLKPLVET